jgi:CheY-like chemotaxis protein
MLVLMNIEDMLVDLGCESVTAAATVDQAVALIEAQVFDAALLDMNLNGIKSFPVADKLAALGVPFVFSTGYSAQDMRDGYRERPLLKKPIRYQELIEVFTRLLSAPSGSLRI